MKKYLITGAMALVAGFYLTSCTHDDVGYDNLYEEKTQSFEKVFKDLYGTIDPNHDWGFTPYVDIVDASAASSTRALTRGAYPNGNMWADEWIVPDPLTEAQKDKVRRWFQQHQNPEGVSFSHSNFFVQQVYKGGTEGKIGPNSPEKYTAADGSEFVGSQHMDHLTCGTWGEGATTSNNDGRNFYDHVNDFNNGNCTDYGGLMLMVNSKSDAFGYYNSNGSVGHNLFVIIPGNEIQEWDNSGGSEANVSNMYFVGLDFEQLIGSDLYSDDWYTGPDGNKYHYLIANMNQYCGDKIQLSGNASSEEIQSLLNQGYLPVKDKNGVFVKLASCADGYYSDWIVRVIPGTKKSSGGGKDPEKEETPTSNKYKARRHLMMARGRIFVEDLYKATREDLDYNDAVYDAIIWYDHDVSVENGVPTTINSDNANFTVEIALLAAGGTIPLKIAGDSFGDVHDAFEVGQTTIVNTVGEASNVFGSMVTGKKYAYHKFDYTTEIFAALAAKKAAGKDVTVSLNDIPVDVEWVVDDISVGARLNDSRIVRFVKDAEGNYVIDENTKKPIIDTSDPDYVEAKAPHMIQVPIGTPWSQERVNINQAHTQFKAWVGDKDEYDDTVWSNSTADLFYCYGDNPSPLAYGDPNTYPNGYSYLTDIIDSKSEITLWEGNLDFGNHGKISLASDAFTKNNAKSGDKIRFYLTSSAPNYWNNNGSHFNENEWDFNIFTGWEQQYKEGSILHVYGDSADISNGYYEFTPSSEDIAALRLELDKEWTPQSSLQIQGHRFILTKITLVP